MTKRPPPVPPANRSTKGTGSAPETSRDTTALKPKSENLAEQGSQGNIKQNTTNQGNQQDR